jgi:hypothetical protein
MCEEELVKMTEEAVWRVLEELRAQVRQAEFRHDGLDMKLSELHARLGETERAVLKVLGWMHFVMARLARSEPQVHEEIDELEKALGG